MAIQVVNLTDTFEEWRVKDNLTASNFGDLSTLSTTDKTSLCAAINEIFTNDSDDMENVVDDTTPELGGDLDVLTRSIVSSSNRNIAITPHGTGLAVITKGDYTGSLNTATTAVTQAVGNNTTLVATTAFVTAQVATEDTLAEMNDTTISGGLANLDVLQYDSSGGGAWKNRTISAAGIPTTGFTVAMAIALG